MKSIVFSFEIGSVKTTTDCVFNLFRKKKGEDVCLLNNVSSVKLHDAPLVPVTHTLQHYTQKVLC